MGSTDQKTGKVKLLRKSHAKQPYAQKQELETQCLGDWDKLQKRARVILWEHSKHLAFLLAELFLRLSNTGYCICPWWMGGECRMHSLFPLMYNEALSMQPVFQLMYFFSRTLMLH